MTKKPKNIKIKLEIHKLVSGKKDKFNYQVSFENRPFCVSAYFTVDEVGYYIAIQNYVHRRPMQVDYVRLVKVWGWKVLTNKELRELETRCVEIAQSVTKQEVIDGLLAI